MPEPESPAWIKKAAQKIVKTGMANTRVVEAIIQSEAQGNQCPFCLDDDFDLIGLKAHLSKEHCDTYNAIEEVVSPFDRPLMPTKESQ